MVGALVFLSIGELHGHSFDTLLASGGVIANLMGLTEYYAALKSRVHFFYIECRAEL